jgi:hypothetical protein
MYSWSSSVPRHRWRAAGSTGSATVTLDSSGIHTSVEHGATGVPSDNPHATPQPHPDTAQRAGQDRLTRRSVDASHAGILRRSGQPPPVSRRRPPTQPRPARHRHHPNPRRHRRPGLLPRKPATGKPPRSTALLKAGSPTSSTAPCSTTPTLTQRLPLDEERRPSHGVQAAVGGCLVGGEGRHRQVHRQRRRGRWREIRSGRVGDHGPVEDRELG